MFKRFLSVVLAALIGAATPAVPAQAPSPAIERGLSVSAPAALPQLAQRLPDTIPPLYMLGGDDKIAPVASYNSATDPFPSASLSHSRGSLATMFDSTGKLTYAPNNLLTHSNTFSNAAWTKTTMSVVSGAIDPFGTAFAWTLTATAPGALLYQSQSLAGPNAIPYVWMRRKTGSGIIYLRNANNVSIDVTAQVSASWSLVYVAPTSALGANLYLIALATSGDEIEVYSTGYSAVTYEVAPRNQDKISTGASAYYGPRIDYDPNTLAVKGLLIEEARTWVALWNRDFTNAAWTKASVTAAKDQSGIDGVANAASSLTATGANGTVLQSITLASSQRATSAYVKRLVGSGVVSMTTDGGATWTDITSQLGSGVYARATIPAQTVTNPSVGFKFATSGDSIAVDFFGNENGAFQTSALAVTTASVTRAADVVQFTGSALTALQGTAGTFIVESISESGSSPVAIANIVRGTNSILYRDTTGKTGTTNGTTALLSAAAPTWNASLRNGLAWSASGRSLAYTGGAVATDANTVSNGGTLYLGSNNGSAVENGWYKSFGIWSQRLGDAALQTKLTVGGSYAANDNGIRYAFADNDNLPIHWRVAL